MQLQGLLFMLLMLVIFPVVILSSNHDLFYIILAVVLFFSSVRNIYNMWSLRNVETKEYEDEQVEEMEFSTDLNIKRFDAGIRTVISLIVVLFFTYCLFYISHLWVKGVAVFVVLFRIFCVVNTFTEEDAYSFITSRLGLLCHFLVNICTVFVILYVTYFKYIKFIW